MRIDLCSASGSWEGPRDITIRWMLSKRVNHNIDQIGGDMVRRDARFCGDVATDGCCRIVPGMEELEILNLRPVGDAEPAEPEAASRIASCLLR